MIAMHKNQPSLNIKNPKKTTYNIKNQKLSKTRCARELTVCASSRWNPRQTPINGSEAKKRGLRSKMCQKSYLKTNIHRYVAKTKSQQRAPFLHIATGHSRFLICIAVCRAIDKQLFTFLEGNRKQTQFHIWQSRVFPIHLSKKIQKLNQNHEVWEHLKTQLTTR